MELFGLLSVMTALGLTFCAMIRYGQNRPERVCAYAADSGDEDIKIAGDKPRTTGSSEDLERLAAIVKAQHDNGNIQRAKRLAVSLVDTVFTHDLFTEERQDQALLLQIRLLIAFTFDICMENGLPNQIAAQTAQNLFYEQITLRERSFYDEIQTTGAFSMYLLCTRSETANSTTIGREFAALCGKEDDADTVKLGKDIFEYYLRLCADKIREAGFVKD